VTASVAAREGGSDVLMKGEMSGWMWVWIALSGVFFGALLVTLVVILVRSSRDAPDQHAEHGLDPQMVLDERLVQGDTAQE
jgi:uncharacterized membrane protein